MTIGNEQIEFIGMNEEVEQIIRDRNNRSEMKVDEQLARYEQKLAESISVSESSLSVQLSAIFASIFKSTLVSIRHFRY